MALSLVFVILSVTLPFIAAVPSPATTECTGTISSLSDVAAAVKCTTVNINAFTVPAGSTFELDLAEGTTVNMEGDVTFGEENWAGPLFQVSGTSITFNGNGHTFDGNGAFYWDGQGINGGVTKPDPMMKIKISGTMTDVKVLNSPARVFSVSNPAKLTLSQITIDNSAGDASNSKSGSKSAGHNTDGFDVSSNNLTIENSIIMNQDDCLALNKGTNIVFQGNTCSGGHGISIGSISSDATVSGVTISGNTITNSDQALRIKTKSSATDASVSGVTYSGNTASNIRKFGVIIDQSYPSTLGTPGTGVKLSDINFTGSKTTISVESGAERVAVNCGSGACTGTWDWSELSVSGGSAGKITNFSGISGYSE
ncbi:glycoside hydrolase family 28 protein [Phlebiopsis gigantea 11061_1 CR5-6]|uniref:endo-polygalacturonase n=1 Tax=Phlebiopsis gigantea (strain 11061_1 CR5-6) TaxID=745531 RepID=A0A0C3S5H9_PHLG1|nr:glycoside hydrolase family 28 protein [Phlebiopsis gigantea 11061_1 CR5-6]